MKSKGKTFAGGLITLVLLAGVLLYAHQQPSEKDNIRYAKGTTTTTSLSGPSVGSSAFSDTGTAQSAAVPNPTAVNKPTLPSQLINLTNWRLTIPVAASSTGWASEVAQPKLASYIDPEFFRLNDTADAILFQASVAGATTSGSHYPRSELREMTNSGHTEASWSNKAGVHTMTLKEAFTHLPTVKSQAVGAQIHDAKDDIIMVRLDNNHLFVQSQGKNVGDLDTNYRLGTVYSTQIVAAEGRIKVYYNDVLKVDIAKTGSQWYFKAGCYTQSNVAHGDAPDAYAQVALYALSVIHVK